MICLLENDKVYDKIGQSDHEKLLSITKIAFSC